VFPRYIEARLQEILADTPVAGLVGPRQSGKTTLARKISGPERQYLTLDDANTLAAAKSDPVGLIRGLDKVVIDEIQRAPDLMLAIKQSVDEDRRPGRFLLTGSANIFTAPRMHDSMAGRIETVTLLPLSQAEIAGAGPSQFLDHAFGGAFADLACDTANAMAAPSLITAVLGGGYPEVLTRESVRRQRDWYRAYVRAIIERDIMDIAVIERSAQMPSFLDALAQYNGQLTNQNDLGMRIGVDRKTAERYMGLLEQLFIVQRLPAWARTDLKRLIKTPKLHFTDSGLVAMLRGITHETIQKNRQDFGPLLETFVLSELRKQASWSEGQYRFSHYRDKDGVEVDIVIENDRGHLIGIEVKAAATVTAADFTGLKKLRANAAKFTSGYLVYDGNRILPFGDALYAIPVSSLWRL
jgi:uncharacterized protein